MILGLLLACASPETQKPLGSDSDSGGVVDSAVLDTADDDTYPYLYLSSWGFFDGPLADLEPVEGVIPYQVVARLWSDGAYKERFFVLPEGGAVTMTETDDWSFPDGSVVIKHFAFPLDDAQPDGPFHHVETRLLVRVDGVWESQIYVWNEEQSEAVRQVAGSRASIDRIDEDGVASVQEYVIPNTNQCEGCHMRDDVMHLLGPDTRQMNREVAVNGEDVAQIDWLASLGFFDAAPPPAATLPAFPDPWDEGVALDTRARAYLHANCSHCHRSGGGGGNSGLVLLADETEPGHYGVCKITAAAGAGTGGNTYDIVPGDPDASIMVYRMSSTDPEIKMPELPNLLPDTEGLELIKAWIAAMDGGCEAEAARGVGP